MGIRCSIETKLSGYDGDGWIADNKIGFWPDVHTGRIIVAKAIGDQKADVCVAKGHFMGEKMPDPVAYDLMSKAFLRRRLDVWQSIRLPMILPEGELGFVRLLARPVLWVSLQSPSDSSSEDYLD